MHESPPNFALSYLFLDLPDTPPKGTKLNENKTPLILPCSRLTKEVNIEQVNLYLMSNEYVMLF